MTRRETIRFGTLFAIACALGKLDALKAEGGQLTVDLAQWREVIFSYRGKTIAIKTSEVFKSLQTLSDVDTKQGDK